VKVGICISLEKAPFAVEAGFDYVELAVSEMCAREPWDLTVYAGLKVEACNLFFPGGVKLFTVERSDAFPILPYLADAKRRLSELGVEVGVVGSGNQRRCPTEIEFPYESSPTDYLWSQAESAEEILARHLAMGSGMPGTTVFAPESLERSESNVGIDCAYFSRILAKHGVGYTADAYHLLKEWDANGSEGGLAFPSDAFWADQMPHMPTHIHLAQLEGRRFPKPNDPMLNGFFARLRELGYDARVSLECQGLDPIDYREAIENVRSYFA
jgi:sugar phosphate isomerase/epimerase